MAVAAMQVQMFIVNGATDTPANTIVVDKMMAVDDVMDKIQEQEGIPHNQQRFVVEDVRAVSDYRLRIWLSQLSVPIETPTGTVWVESRTARASRQTCRWCSFAQTAPASRRSTDCRDGLLSVNTTEVFAKSVDAHVNYIV